MFIRAYLRASTEDQDAGRARDYLEEFVAGHGKAIAASYMENASGSHADRPELIRLLKDSRRGDVLLVESIDRLSRMDDQAWRSLKSAIDSRGIRIVSVDLPTSHQGITAQSGDEFTDRMLAAINYMMIDMMAAIARKDYQQRRLRQAQGIAKAKGAGVYKGRPVDVELRKRVRELLGAGLGIRAVARHAMCSTTTVMKVRDDMAGNRSIIERNP
jgi:DNA invertase Pin-like site-specific DNA recombinase